MKVMPVPVYDQGPRVQGPNPYAKMTAHLVLQITKYPDARFDGFIRVDTPDEVQKVAAELMKLGISVGPLGEGDIITYRGADAGQLIWIANNVLEIEQISGSYALRPKAQATLDTFTE